MSLVRVSYESSLRFSLILKLVYTIIAAAKAKNFSLYRNLNLDDTQTPIVDKEKLVPENRKLFVRRRISSKCKKCKSMFFFLDVVSLQVFIKTPLVETRSYSAPPESLAYFGQERESK